MLKPKPLQQSLMLLGERNASKGFGPALISDMPHRGLGHECPLCVTGRAVLQQAFG